MNFKNKQTRQYGFTLIELLVVIAIISLLSSIIMASVSSAREKARDSKRISDIRQVQIAIDLYYDENGQYPTPDFDGCGGWDIGNNTLPFLNGKLNGIMDNPPNDPIATGNCSGYRYYRYNAGTSGCDVSNGSFYVLGITEMETSGMPHPYSPGWSCPGRDWQADMEWVTGKFENL